MSRDNAKRTPRWMRILLILSLAANLCVIAAVTTVAWHHAKPGHHYKSHHRGHHGGKIKGVGGPLIRALSDQERQILREDMKSIRRAGKTTQETLRKTDEQILDVLRGTPFDPSALTTLLAQKQTPVIQRMEQGRALLVAHIAAMSENERADYAERVETELTAHHNRRKKHE